MREDTQADEAHAEAHADETPPPEPEDRAIGVASVPEDAAAPEYEARLVDNGDDTDTDTDTDTDDDVDSHATTDVPEPAVPTQRFDAEEPPAGGMPDDEVPHDEACDRGTRDDESRDDFVSRDDAPVPAMAYELAGERTVTGESVAHDELMPGVAHDELMPGDVPEQKVSGLFDQSAADGFRDRWQRVQMQFVDNPKSAAGEAKALVDDVFAAARQALDKQRGALDGWQSDESGQPDDTERLRIAVRGYRDFLERMLGL